MDVDEGNSMLSDRSGRTETLFAKSEEMSAAFYANLPVEVRQVLKNAGE
jgi:nuclear pore complex protein Nup133